MNEGADTKKFFCSVCSRHFGRLEHLQRHSRRHTKEKPYICHCGRSFTRRDLLTRHNRLVHTPPANQTLPSTHGPEPSRAREDTQVEVPTVPSNGNQDNRFISNSWIAELPLASENDSATVNSGSSADTDVISSLPMFQEFGYFTDTIGFMGMDFIEPSGRFFQFGGNMPYSDTRETVDELSSPPSSIDDDIPELKPLVVPWRVSGEVRRRLVIATQLGREYAHKMPTCLSLNRYCAGFFSEFQSHVPIVHKGTFEVSSASIEHPELLLAIAAIGAIYRFRKPDAFFLFRASAEIMSKKRLDSSMSGHYGVAGLQTLVLLKYFSLWHKQSEVRDEQLLVHSILLEWMQNFHVPDLPEGFASSWACWAFRESAVRSYLAAFCIFNSHSLTVGTPPDVVNLAVKSSLPSSAAAWDALSADKWAPIISTEAPAPDFQTALAQLFAESEIHFIISPFGCLVLLHAIIQRTVHLRQLSFDGMPRPSDIKDIEGALTRWKRCWKHTPESVLDPRNLDATISFQSISLLMTAYLRLGRKALPPFYHLTMPFDPRQFASLLIPPGSGGKIADWHINALVHSAHTLMVLVKAGVDYQRRVLSYHWDPHHFMPWIEGAVSLAHWLLIHAELRPESRLAQIESCIILWTHYIMTEAFPSLDDEDSQLLCTAVKEFSIDDPQSIRIMAYGVIATWCCIIPGGNNPWPIVETAGEVLNVYKRLLRPRAMLRLNSLEQRTNM